MLNRLKPIAIALDAVRKNNSSISNYTSSLMVDPLPVVHLGFQEPSDDPRNFCYLWAVHSSTAESSGTRGPLAYMYALFFKSKDWLDGYGYLYRDFQSCRLRLEYIMPTLDCGKKKVVASRCVSYQTLNSISQRNVLEPEYDDSASENDLCAFVWEVYGSEGETKATRLSLFDLNQWYKDQMPSCVEDDDDDDSLNPCYLVTFSLADIWKCKSPGPLLDVRIDPHNVQLFKSFQSHEEYFQPSALSFISRSLLGEKIVSVTHPGVQRFILSKMDEEGPLVLLDPKLLFENCFKVGLRPLLVELPVNINIISEVEMRHYLLSVALENGKQDFLHHCAKQWANGSHSKAGCTLHMLVDWSYHRASVLKTHAHSLCEPLFNHSGDRLDKNQRAILDNCILQLHHLSTLFQTIMECTQNYSSKEFLEEIDAVARALKLVDMYFAVLQWFLNGGLLPEFPEDSVVDNYDEERNSPEFVLQNIPYPVTALRRIYQRRRKELEDVSSMCGESLPLFIDSLLSHESPEGVARVAELWCSDGGDDSYPPPSLQSLLQTYLIEGISIHVKHAVVIYLFLDLAALLDRERYRDAIDYFIKFPSAMCMSPSNIKIIQAFYLLDQGNFEEALDMILDPLVSSTEVQPWQHTYMVRALMSQRQHTKALEYCEHNLPDVRLKITLLVIIGQVSEAHRIQRLNRNDANCIELLEHFFRVCEKEDRLGMVLNLQLTPLEEEIFMNYLETSKHPKANDMRVIYFLMRTRIVEAISMNNKINGNGHKFDNSVRNLLVEAYAKTLPSVTQKLLHHCIQERKALSRWKQVDRPTPLSVVVRPGASQPVSYKSSLYLATLQKARETWMIPIAPPCTPVSKEKEKESSAIQFMPFLCTPQDGIREDVLSTSAILSSKRLQEEQGGTPKKRPCREVVAPPISSEVK
ncbi:protein ELYS [Anabrus simplex]|uniref:protein ELYS n=1 Tax=Anabrus simplex TaxID=316456 RepID=UPI0035A36387